MLSQSLAIPGPRGWLPIWLGAFLVGCFWLVVLRQLGAQWSIYESYHFGWGMPFLCGFLVWRRCRGKVMSSVPARGAPSAGLNPTAAGWIVVGIALLYAPTRFLHEANPIWRLTSLLLTLEVIALTLVIITLAKGPTGFRNWLFPLLFFLVAVPWPSSLENFLVRSFTSADASATVGLLGMLGIPSLQHGNAIEVGTGWVGIDEACSGIRSFQATAMIALFLGEFYRLGWSARCWCLLAGVGWAFGLNLLRTTLLVWLEATRGTRVMEQWHDPAGVTILLAGFLGLWSTARLLAGPPPAVKDENLPRSRSDPLPRQLPLALTGGLLAWLILVEAGTEGWYRVHETPPPGAVPWDLRANSSLPGFARVGIPREVLGQFRADRAMEFRCPDASGNQWQVYYFRWFPSRTLAHRLAVQIAKTHGPEKCLPAMGMSLVSHPGLFTVSAGSLTLAFQHYLFADQGRVVHVFYALYEDPSGTAQLANRRTDMAGRIDAAWAGSRNYGQRLLEIAVSGPERPADARAALARELPAWIGAVE